MADSAARLDILIDIKARLDELARANAELRNTREGAKYASGELGSFFSQFRQGLGLGAGMFTIATAVATAKAVIVQTTVEAMRMAGAIKDNAEALSMSRRGYQVFGEVMRDAGGQQERMNMAIGETNRKLAEARAMVGPAAAAFRDLGLDPAKLEGMSVERRMEAIGRAIASTTDKQQAFRAAGVLLGSRNLPTLLNALKQLGVEGYDKLAEKIERAGRLMGDDTIARLDRAEKAIEQWRRKKTIGFGESLIASDDIRKSVMQDITGANGIFDSSRFRTLGAMLKAALFGDFGSLATTVAGAVKLEKDPEQSDPEATRAAAELQAKRLELRRLNLQLLQLEISAEDKQNQQSLTDQERREAEITYLDQKAKLLDRIANVTASLPLDTGDEGQREQEIAKLRGAALGARTASGNASLPLSDAALTNRNYDDFTAGRRSDGGARLSAGDGLMAGYQNWAMSLGTAGEQAAGALQSTLGTTVDGITESILGWATGAGDFADVARSTGLTVLHTMLQTLVQIGMQQILNGTIAKTMMIGLETLMDTLRGARVAKENAAEMATLPAKTAGAAASGISSFGAALVFGAAALAIIMAAMTAFADGGPVRGAGGPRDDSILARLSNGEYVVPAHVAQHPRNAGLMASLEGQRRGLPGFALGGFIGDLLVYGGIPKFLLPNAARNFLQDYNWINGEKLYGGPRSNGYEYVNGEWRALGAGADRYGVTTAGRASGGGYSLGARGAGVQTSEMRPVRYLALVDSRDTLESLRRDSNFENVVVDIGRRNRGVILEDGV